MEPELFKTFGQIAGIGGIALGVFLLLFRDIIRKSIFPQLKKDDAFRLLRLISILVFFTGMAGVGAWVWAEQSHGITQEATINGDENKVEQTVGK